MASAIIAGQPNQSDGAENTTEIAKVDRAKISRRLLSAPVWVLGGEVVWGAVGDMLWVCCSFGSRSVYLQRVLRRFVIALVWTGKKNWGCLHAAHVYAVQTGAVQAARQGVGRVHGVQGTRSTVQGAVYVYAERQFLIDFVTRSNKLRRSTVKQTEL